MKTIQTEQYWLVFIAGPQMGDRIGPSDTQTQLIVEAMDGNYEPEHYIIEAEEIR